MSTRIVVVSVYDRLTGWSTLPVAVVGWRTGWTCWDWVPKSEPALRLRYDVIEDLEPDQREAWLQRFFDQATLAYSVDEVDTLGVEEQCVVEQVVRDTLDDLLVAGA